MAGYLVEVEYKDYEFDTTADYYGPYRRPRSAQRAAERLTAALRRVGIELGVVVGGNRAVTVSVRTVDDIKVRPIVAEARRFLDLDTRAKGSGA